MHSDEFRRFGHRLIDWIADYRAKVAERPVMSRAEPGDVRAMLPASPPEQAESFEGVLGDLERVEETHASTSLAYCRVDKCGDACIRLGNRN